MCQVVYWVRHSAQGMAAPVLRLSIRTPRQVELSVRSTALPSGIIELAPLSFWRLIGAETSSERGEVIDKDKGRLFYLRSCQRMWTLSFLLTSDIKTAKGVNGVKSPSECEFSCNFPSRPRSCAGAPTSESADKDIAGRRLGVEGKATWRVDGQLMGWKIAFKPSGVIPNCILLSNIWN